MAGYQEDWSGGNNTGAYSNTAGLDQYMKPAQNSLEQMIQLFRQGGGYGAGQNAIIDTQANQAQARAASDAVASGMSSGSLAASTGARIAGDTAKAKLGVEDTRTNYLAQAMKMLSDMFTNFGGMNSQERMQKAQLDKQGSIADMNAGISLIGNRPQSRSVMPGFGPNNFWGEQTPAIGNGYNSPQF